MAATLAGIFVSSEGGMPLGAEAPKSRRPVVGEGWLGGHSHVDARIHATAALRASAAHRTLLPIYTQLRRNQRVHWARAAARA